MTPLESDAISGELARVSRTAGVSLAVATQGSDGLVLHAEGNDLARAPAAAALGAALFVRAAAAAAAQGHGEVRLLRLQCVEGQLLATSAAGVVIVVVAGIEANAGRIRLELLRAAEALS